MPRWRADVPLLGMALAGMFLLACSDRAPIAIKGSVHNFYAAISVDNQPGIQAFLAPGASQDFRDHAMKAAVEAQHDERVLRSVQVVRIDTPVVKDHEASVRVVFADGGSDEVSLVQVGVAWKVLSSGRLA